MSFDSLLAQDIGNRDDHTKSNGE